MQTAAYSLPSADLGRVQTWQRCLTILYNTQYSTVQYSTLNPLLCAAVFF